MLEGGERGPLLGVPGGRLELRRRGEHHGAPDEDDAGQHDLRRHQCPGPEGRGAPEGDLDELRGGLRQESGAERGQDGGAGLHGGRARAAPGRLLRRAAARRQVVEQLRDIPLRGQVRAGSPREGGQALVEGVHEGSQAEPEVRGEVLALLQPAAEGPYEPAAVGRLHPDVRALRGHRAGHRCVLRGLAREEQAERPAPRPHDADDRGEYGVAGAGPGRHGVLPLGRGMARDGPRHLPAQGRRGEVRGGEAGGGAVGERRDEEDEGDRLRSGRLQHLPEQRGGPEHPLRREHGQAGGAEGKVRRGKPL
mmetsp:Transcript_66380/g.187009  ORF Transcript_66380/g.187009 Transcript_66380/m.187009 type:complete len:308 (+) Transcript_66380:684-1607(+)